MIVSAPVLLDSGDWNMARGLEDVSFADDS